MCATILQCYMHANEVHSCASLCLQLQKYAGIYVPTYTLQHNNSGVLSHGSRNSAMRR